MTKKLSKAGKIGKANKARGNRTERIVMTWCKKHTSGLHPYVESIATDTGRVGNYANLEIDGVFVEYSVEVKSKSKAIPAWFKKGFEQAIGASEKFSNHPLVVFYLKALPPEHRWWHVISAERHAELLAKEQELERRGNGSGVGMTSSDRCDL